MGRVEAQLEVTKARLSRAHAKLREEGIVAAGREGKVVHYSLVDARVHALVDAICKVMLGPDADPEMRVGAERAGEKQ